MRLAEVSREYETVSFKGKTAPNLGCLKPRSKITQCPSQNLMPQQFSRAGEALQLLFSSTRMMKLHLSKKMKATIYFFLKAKIYLRFSEGSKQSYTRAMRAVTISLYPVCRPGFPKSIISCFKHCHSPVASACLLTAWYKRSRQ